MTKIMTTIANAHWSLQSDGGHCLPEPWIPQNSRCETGLLRGRGLNWCSNSHLERNSGYRHGATLPAFPTMVMSTFTTLKTVRLIIHTNPHKLVSILKVSSSPAGDTWRKPSGHRYRHRLLRLIPARLDRAEETKYVRDSGRRLPINSVPRKNRKASTQKRPAPFPPSSYKAGRQPATWRPRPDGPRCGTRRACASFPPPTGRAAASWRRMRGPPATAGRREAAGNPEAAGE